MESAGRLFLSVYDLSEGCGGSPLLLLPTQINMLHRFFPLNVQACQNSICLDPEAACVICLSLTSFSRQALLV